MKSKNLKLTIIALATLGIILVFGRTLIDISSPDFSLFEFSKGMLAGMSGVAAVVWFGFLISTIVRADKTDGLISLIIKNRQILFGAVLLCFLVGTIITTLISDNALLLITGALVMSTAMVLNILYLKETVCNKIFGKLP